jgi:hypothetical protein
MAESVASAQSSATEEAPEGVGWLGEWFWGGGEAARHGFDA